MFTAFIKILPVGEMPSHNHTANTNVIDLQGTLDITSWTTRNPYIISSQGTVFNSNAPEGQYNQSWIRYKINTSHSHTITINNTGSSQAHNNIQPYIAIYIWKRVS